MSFFGTIIIINQIFRPNHIPKRTMNVQKTHTRQANMMHDVYERQKANVDITFTQITGHIDVYCTVIEAFLYKKHFSELKKERKKNIIGACGFVTIKMTNRMGCRRA